MGDLLDHPFAPDIDLRHSDTRKPQESRSSGYQWVLAAVNVVVRVWWEALRGGASLVHVHTSGGWALVEKSLLVALLRVSGKRVLMHMHVGNLDAWYREGGSLRRQLVRVMLRLPDRVVAVAAYWRRFLVSEIGLDHSKVVVVRNGVRSAQYERAMGRLTDRRCTVLFLGRIHEEKGIAELFDAMDLVVRDGLQCRLLMVGPDSDGGRTTEMFKRLAAQREWHQWVEWRAGAIGQDKARVLNEADVFVLPSRAEGLPLALLEAMASGLACVATSVGGVPEVIVHGENGLLVPPRAPVAVAGALRMLVGDPALRDRLGRAACNSVRQHWDRESAFAELEDLYREVARQQTLVDRGFRRCVAAV